MEIDQGDTGDAVQSDQVDGSEGDTAETTPGAAPDALQGTVAAGTSSDADATQGAAVPTRPPREPSSWTLKSKTPI